MNQKQAKRIRRNFATPAELRRRDYVVAKEGRKLVRTGRLTPQGNPELIVMYWRTIRLHPDCPRALYQQMKAAA